MAIQHKFGIEEFFCLPVCKPPFWQTFEDNTINRLALSHKNKKA